MGDGLSVSLKFISAVSTRLCCSLGHLLTDNGPERLVLRPLGERLIADRQEIEEQILALQLR
jgi:hypothetical protein